MGKRRSKSLSEEGSSMHESAPTVQILQEGPSFANPWAFEDITDSTPPATDEMPRMLLEQIEETARHVSAVLNHAKDDVSLLFTDDTIPLLSYENVEVLLLGGFHAFPDTVPDWKAHMQERLSFWYGVGRSAHRRFNCWLKVASILAEIDFEEISLAEREEVRAAYKRLQRYWDYMIAEARKDVQVSVFEHIVLKSRVAGQRPGAVNILERFLILQRARIQRLVSEDIIPRMPPVLLFFDQKIYPVVRKQVSTAHRAAQ